MQGRYQRRWQALGPRYPQCATARPNSLLATRRPSLCCVAPLAFCRPFIDHLHTTQHVQKPLPGTAAGNRHCKDLSRQQDRGTEARGQRGSGRAASGKLPWSVMLGKRQGGNSGPPRSPRCLSFECSCAEPFFFYFCGCVRATFDLGPAARLLLALQTPERAGGTARASGAPGPPLLPGLW